VDTKSDISWVPRKGKHWLPVARRGVVTTVALTVSVFAALSCDTGVPDPRAATPSSIVIIDGTPLGTQLARGSTMDAAADATACDGEQRRAGFAPTDLAAPLCDHADDADYSAVASGPHTPLRPSPIDCEPTVQRGHVPGALEAVLKIECTSMQADASSTSSVDSRARCRTEPPGREDEKPE
jgi:hypothetical protein